MQFFATGASHRDKIVTRHNHRHVWRNSSVHRVGVIANMDNFRSRGESSAQLPRKQNELVDVSEPFAEKILRAKKFSKNWRRRSDFWGNSGGRQSLQHHGGESLHALLAIKRVITDQQNHWYDRY